MKRIFNDDGTITLVMTEDEYFNSNLKLTPISTPMPIERVDMSLEQKVTDILARFGISRAIKGFAFLRTAIILSAGDRKYLDNITGLLYPAIAQEYDTKPSRAERAMRHGISTVSDYGPLFPRHTSESLTNPTVSEFIATIADGLRLDGWLS